MQQKCNCGGWLEYTDTDNDENGKKFDWYVCIDCGKEYRFYFDEKTKEYL